ncbi:MULTISPECIES: hypothetical protein [Parachlamydia]|jgi:hypothetical protein|uniref:Uncharacterized protein n=1 Tax=Parachlamydia acanthamoebae TaxID=83552 RepID=A0A0C1CCB0_9BACT|nr:hypothetical protein [Parachlamydia acanthamoebae]EFB40120.1 hypothetical protein pah_c260o021 [Parachlamydia acanthamoebae str. Hall's coccus]KIA78515.1 hypothetical protein DB43_DW00110 [Parachlamydia acanthamoebae]
MLPNESHNHTFSEQWGQKSPIFTRELDQALVYSHCHDLESRRLDVISGAALYQLQNCIYKLSDLIKMPHISLNHRRKMVHLLEEDIYHLKYILHAIRIDAIAHHAWTRIIDELYKSTLEQFAKEAPMELSKEPPQFTYKYPFPESSFLMLEYQSRIESYRPEEPRTQQPPIENKQQASIEKMAGKCTHIYHRYTTIPSQTKDGPDTIHHYHGRYEESIPWKIDHLQKLNIAVQKCIESHQNNLTISEFAKREALLVDKRLQKRITDELNLQNIKANATACKRKAVELEEDAKGSKNDVNQKKVAREKEQEVSQNHNPRV